MIAPGNPIRGGPALRVVGDDIKFYFGDDLDASIKFNPASNDLEIVAPAGALYAFKNEGVFEAVTGAIRLGDNAALYIGGASDTRILWSTAQTVDALMIGLQNTDMYAVITTNGKATSNYGIASQPNPTVAWADGSATLTNVALQRQTGVDHDITPQPATGRLTTGRPFGPGQYTVAGLPAGVEGSIAYATDGRKTGEAAGLGTGVPVYFSNGSWRRFYDDAAVTA